MTKDDAREIAKVYEVLKAYNDVFNVATGTGGYVQVHPAALFGIGPVTFKRFNIKSYPWSGSVVVDGVEFMALFTQDDYDHYTAAVSPATA